jgi:single-strand DNA-binding protein
VIVTGRLKQRSFETREGEKRTVVEVEVDEIGPSLRYATAKVNKASRGGGGGGGGFGSGGGSRPAPAPAQTSSAPADDPWGSAPASGSFGGGDDEPPF